MMKAIAYSLQLRRAAIAERRKAEQEAAAQRQTNIEQRLQPLRQNAAR